MPKTEKKITKRTELTKMVEKPRFAFFKLDVGSVESLEFFTALFTFLEFKITWQSEQEVDFTNGEIGIVVYHAFNVVGSGIYILNTGINALFFRVKGRKEVDRFADKFLKVRRIPTTTNESWREKEEGKYSVFFKTPELITIGIISD